MTARTPSTTPNVLATPSSTVTSPCPPQATQRTFLFRHTHPDKTSVFETHNPAIAIHLRRRPHTWKVLEITSVDQYHHLISQSCIIELPDHKIRIDERFLRGQQHARVIRAKLIDKGKFTDPDVRFVGAIAESRTVEKGKGAIEEFLDWVDGSNTPTNSY